MCSVFCVFYCIYSDVQRSIRKGNNPKVKESISMVTHRLIYTIVYIPLKILIFEFNILIQGQEVQIIRCNLHATKHKADQIAP